MLFSIVGAIISVLGVISGIIVGIRTENFLISLCVWIGTFLYAIIYFGIGMILKKQEMILGIITPKDSSSSSLYPQGCETESKNSPPSAEPEQKSTSNDYYLSQLSGVQVAQIQELIKKDNKYQAAKLLSDMTGMDFSEAVVEIKNF